MASNRIREAIIALDPCPTARKWIESLPPEQPPEQSYAACERGDWLLWLAAEAGVDRRLVVLAACDVARPALVHVPAGDDRPWLAIEAAERRTRGEATPDEVRLASHDAYLADGAYAVVRGARAATYAARAAYATADASIAADATDVATLTHAVAIYAANAAATTATTAADTDEAYAAALAESARLVRSRIPLAMIADALLKEAK